MRPASGVTGMRTFGLITVTWTALALAAWPALAMAQGSRAQGGLVQSVTTTKAVAEADRAALDQAIRRGQMLYAYDQAAWHGTDSMQEAAVASGKASEIAEMLGGWVVQGPVASPTVTFFDRDRENPGPVYVIETTDGGRKVVSTRRVYRDAGAVLDAQALAMVRARRAALHAIPPSQALACADGQSVNTVVLPPEQQGGPTLVYVMTPQTSLDKVPFGGHFRIPVGPDGQAGPVHAFTRTCPELSIRSEKGEKAEALVASQLNDPLPTEISVFTMYAAQVPLYLTIPASKSVWLIDQVEGKARIAPVAEPAMP